MTLTSARVLITALYLGLQFGLSDSRPDGAPVGVCQTMRPGHGAQQLETIPYSIQIDATEYTPGGSVKVTIAGPAFQGIILQARKTDPNAVEALGTFSDPGATSNLRLLSCASVAGSAITHANTNGKTGSVVVWNPPETDQGDILFIATVAQAKDVWWRNIRSSALKAVYTTSSQQTVTSGEPIQTTSSPAKNTYLPDQPSMTTQVSQTPQPNGTSSPRGTLFGHAVAMTVTMFTIMAYM